MPGSVITLIALALSLAWAVLLRGGVLPSDWVSTVLFVGGISGAYWMFVRRRLVARPLSRWVVLALWAMPVYLAFQLVPLPLPLLKTLSPARAQLASALTPVLGVVSKAPLSVNIPMAVLWAFSFLCYLAVFFLVRELGWRFAGRPWLLPLPLLLIASMEAVVGLIQVFANWPAAEARGTYANRDHFSGLLEMTLPFALLYGWSLLRAGRRFFDTPSRLSLIAASASFTSAALILLAIAYSLSHMGLFAALCSFFAIAALTLGPRLPSQNVRMVGLVALALGTLAVFVFLPPDQLLERFADLAASGKITTETRLSIWKETLSLIAEFPLFGCGLGGFESTFLKYQGTANAFRVEMAHNDYLQYLAELGLVGFAIFIAAAVGVLAPIAKAVFRRPDADDDDAPETENRRLVLIACVGSFVAIGLHSLVDFNLYIPANAMTLAWIAGIASIHAQE